MAGGAVYMHLVVLVEARYAHDVVVIMLCGQETARTCVMAVTCTSPTLMLNAAAVSALRNGIAAGSGVESTLRMNTGYQAYAHLAVVPTTPFLSVRMQRQEGD